MVGAVTASLAVRPKAWIIFPVPILSYLVAALASGIVFDRSDTSNTARALAAAQWIANGFFAMALATVLAVVITTVRWYRRRGRPGTRERGGPSPTGGPARSGRAGTGFREDRAHPGLAPPGLAQPQRARLKPARIRVPPGIRGSG